MMIMFTEGNIKFNFRIVGVTIKDSKVLLHKSPEDDFWALPGGRAELLETSEETLVREMKEELNEEIKVERLLWIIENYFEYQAKDYHELSLYYLINFNSKSEIYNLEEFEGKEEGKSMIFKWFEIDRLDEISVKPDFLREGLNNLPNNIKRIVIKENRGSK